MIELLNVSKSYSGGAHRIAALDEVSLSIPEGKIFGIIGKSGAGKSTLIRMINLLEKPDHGEIIVNQANLTKLNKKKLLAARKNIGMIFQHFNLLSSRDVWSNITLPLEINKQKIKNQLDRIKKLIKLTGLQNKESQYPNQLSGGQKQRVAIARALVSEPKILLCDEATSALDPETTKNILTLLLEINKTLGLTIVLITHEMHVVKQICDRVAVLDQGKIVEENSILKFFTNPQSKAGKALVNAYIEHEFPAQMKLQISTKYSPKANPVLRIFFFGKSAESPLISKLIQTFHLQINIIQANIEIIKEETLGIMTFTMINQQQLLPKVLDFFQQAGVRVEVVGYVKHHA